MEKKQKEFKKQVEKMLAGELTEVMSVNILLGQGGVTGGFRFDKKIDKKFRKNFGEKYEEIVEEFKEATTEPSKKAGRKLAKLIIEDALDSKIVDGTNNTELSELLVKLGEILGAKMKEGAVEVVEIEPNEDDDDDEEDED